MSSVILELDVASRAWREARAGFGPGSDEAFDAACTMLRSWVLADPDRTPLFGGTDPQADVRAVLDDARLRPPADQSFIHGLAALQQGPQACATLLQHCATEWGPWERRTVELGALACLRWPAMPPEYRDPIAAALPGHPDFGPEHPLTILLNRDATRAARLQPPLPLTLLPHLRAVAEADVNRWRMAGGDAMGAALPVDAGRALSFTGDQVRQYLPESVEAGGDELHVPPAHREYLDRALDLLGIPGCVHGPRTTLRWRLADGLFLVEARYLHPADGLPGRWVAASRFLGEEQADAYDEAVADGFRPDNHREIEYLWYFEPFCNQSEGEPVRPIAGYSSDDPAESQEIVELMTAGLASSLRGLPGRIRPMFRLDWDGKDKTWLGLWVTAEHATLQAGNAVVEQVADPTDADVLRLVRRLYVDAQGYEPFGDFEREALFLGARYKLVSAG